MFDKIKSLFYYVKGESMDRLKELDIRIMFDDLFATCKNESETENLGYKLRDLVEYSEDERNEALGVYDE
jgi:hypothetical protein